MVESGRVGACSHVGDDDDWSSQGSPRTLVRVAVKSFFFAAEETKTANTTLLSRSERKAFAGGLCTTTAVLCLCFACSACWFASRFELRTPGLSRQSATARWLRFAGVSYAVSDSR